MKRNIRNLGLVAMVLGAIVFESPAKADVRVDPAASKGSVAKLPPEDALAFSPDACMRKKDNFMQSLSLSDEQLQKMSNLRDQFHIATAAKGAEMKALFHQIGAKLAEPNLDKKGVEELHAKSVKLQAELSDEHFKFMTANAEILTPEQRKKMHQMMLQHQAGPGPGGMPFMGPGMGMMPPPMMPPFGGPGGPGNLMFGPFGPPGMGHPGMGHPPGSGGPGPGRPGPGMPPPSPGFGGDAPPEHPPASSGNG
jgi:Spy/CpxP family protein refolding chaperone